MEIKSLAFIGFLIITILLYFLAGKIKNAQKYVLLMANTAFIYLAAGKIVLLLVICIVLLSYVIGRIVDGLMQKDNKKAAHVAMWAGVIIHVAILCFFKFFGDSYRAFQQTLLGYGLSIPNFVVPVGVSYYTLTMVAYVLDIYHRKHRAETNVVDYFTFITYFPSIVEGPINLYKKIAPQIKAEHKPDWDRTISGLQRMLWGYFKKVVIADRIGIPVMGILRDSESGGFLILWAMIMYSFQIYTDFSGGIDVIMGVSEILGIELSENFRAPLMSKSITEYWQRWHMSLGEFMEKYIYYPIVLNRSVMKFSKKIPNKYLQKVFSATLASVIVFVIVGIWHGTGWNYVVYGCYQALFVSSAVLLGPVYKNINQKLKVNEKCLGWNIFRILRTFTILVFGRYFIKAYDLGQAGELFARTFSNMSMKSFGCLFDGTLLEYGLGYKELYLMYICVVLVILVDFIHDKKIHIRKWIMEQDVVVRYAIYMAGIFAIIIFGIYGPGFTESTFIYQGF